MTDTTRARLERVTTDDGFHGRIVAGNNEPTWSTQVLEDLDSVDVAILSATRMLLGDLPCEIDRDHAGERWLFIGAGMPTVRVVDVDERGEAAGR